MPRNRTEAPEPQRLPSTALAIPPDIRADLLRAQASAITTPQRFVRLKVLPAAAGLFELTDTNDTMRDFEGVVLGHHARNVLWEQPYGSDDAPRRGGEEENSGPACRSNDGLHGTPRAGFYHHALGGNVPATGEEVIACATCPYNQWGSITLLPDKMGPTTSTKGKAVTNQRSIYIVLPDRATPVELTISGTSIPGFDEYLTTLLNHGIPAQAVRTRFAQRIMSKGRLRWAVVTYQQAAPLNAEEFDSIMELYRQWGPSINPSLRDATPTAAPNAETLDVREGTPPATDDDDMPNF